MAAGGGEGRAELVRASLAAEEKEALEAIKGDLCRWLARGEILGLDAAPATFLETLDSGEQLCRLAGLVCESARRREEEGKEPPVRVPSLKLACKPIKAARGTPMFLASARDNAAQFIQWCRDLGVEEAVIFESVGLVEHSDERRVVLCLLDVARFAEKVGVSPPELVALEREIEELESPSTAERGRTGEEREVDTSTATEEEEKEEEEVEEEKEEEEKEGKEIELHSSNRKEMREEESGAQGEKKREVEVEEGGGEGEGKEPPAKRVKRGSATVEAKEAVTPPQNQLKRRKKSSPHNKLKNTGKNDTVDRKVMQSVNECTCKRTIQVHHCGNGKFTVASNSPSSPKSSVVTIYARLLSDRVMVRVGGGWETLEHFLLKHDPCRADHLTDKKPEAARNSRKRAREL